jgi:hypothetical protein
VNIADALEALNLATERVVSFGLRNNFRHDGMFFVYAHELGQAAVDAAKADELRRNPGLPLVASAGMKPGTHVALIESKSDKNLDQRTVWMSTHEAEKTTQAEFVAEARGRVLIAGFGLGMVTDAVLSKPEVTEVVVVEKNTEVTQVMSPLIDDMEARHGGRLRIVYGDAFRWFPYPGKKYDAIYFDIWPDISPKNMVGMLKLRRRFKKNLAPGGWMGCWAEAECRESLRRLERTSPNAGRALKAIDDVYGQEGVVLNLCTINEGA